MPLRKVILVLRLIVALTMPEGALAEPMRLQSAAGDQVEMTEAVRIGCAQAPCPARVCLENPASNSGDKGLSNRRSAPPDLVVPPGEAACQNMAAVRQTLVLWREIAEGHMLPALVAPLDLRNKAARLIFLKWIVEAERLPAEGRENE